MKMQVIEGPRIIKPEEYEQTISLLDNVFYSGVDGEMCRHYPTSFPNTPECQRNQFVISVEGEIVSHTSIFPRHAHCDGRDLSTAGVGGVATKPEHRGSGFASRLIEFGIEEMTDRGFDVSVLWGLRGLYRKWGWEMSGREVMWHLDSETLVRLDKEDSEVRPLEADDLTMVAALHLEERVHVERSPEDYAALLFKPDVESYATFGREGFAYVTFGRHGAVDVLEAGGEPTGVAHIIRWFLHDRSIGRIAIHQPSCDSHIGRFLSGIAADWEVRPAYMALILNLCSTLYKVLDGRPVFEGPNCSLTLEMEDQRCRLMADRCIRVDDRASAENVISLTRCEAARLLFGPRCPDEELHLEPQHRWLNAIFPIPMYFWPLDKV